MPVAKPDLIYRTAKVDSLSESFQRCCAIDLYSAADDRSSKEIPKVADLSSLSHSLPGIVSDIFNRVGSQQCEATYQRCLKVDLEEAGIGVMLEPVIELKYRGVVVGTRRPDLVLSTSCGERAVIELKAVVGGICASHLNQLEYYMSCLDIDRGYLVNFPHDQGFPSLDESMDFAQTVLLGDVKDSNMRRYNLRLRNDPEKRKAEVVEVDRRILAGHEREKAAAKAKEEIDDSPKWGKTKAGLPCKVCIRERRYCSMHKYQE